MIKALLNWFFQDDAMLKEWNEKFPNKCIICGFQAYGYVNGMTQDPNPPPHNCTYAQKSTESNTTGT